MNIFLHIRTFKIVVVLVVLAVILGACGSNKEDDKPTSTPLARFEQVATSTVSAAIATSVPTPIAHTPKPLNPTAIARGQTSWERLECVSCHGEQGAGGTGEIDGVAAPALIDTALSETEFIDWLRTGGSVGNDHLFSTDRLSDNGGKNLYQFVLSLSISTDQ